MDCYVHSWCTSRILFYQIVTSVSCTLLEFLFNGLFRYYLVRFYDLLSMDCYLSIWRFKDSLDCYVLYLTDFKHSFSLDCNVSISRTFRIFFIELLRQSLAHFQDSFSLDCYVSILRTFRVLIDMECYVSLLCLLGFIFDGQFRQYLAHSQDSLSSEVDQFYGQSIRRMVKLTTEIRNSLETQLKIALKSKFF